MGFVQLVESIENVVVRASPGFELRKKRELGKEMMCGSLRHGGETEVHATEKRWRRSWELRANRRQWCDLFFAL